MSRLIPLDDRDALDVSRVGVKAAWLAGARQRGFNVLPGYVVPVEESCGTVEAGRRVLDDLGVGAARLAAGRIPLEPALLDELSRLGHLGPTLVVRSSTGLDDSGAFAGAFGSLSDIAPSELDIAVVGCWASLFAPDVLDRLGHADLDHDAVGMAVLVQPQLTPQAGGWARLTVDGGVEIAAIDGPPGPLLAGWLGGSRHRVGIDGSLEGDAGRGPINQSVLREVAGLMRALGHDLGAGRVEWALMDGSIVVLQVDPAETQGRQFEPPAPIQGVAGEPFVRLARVLVGRTGRLADAMIAAWGAAAPTTIRATALAGRPAAQFAQARNVANDLATRVAAAAGMTTTELLAGLATADPRLTDRLADARVDPAAAGRVLGTVAAVGETLAEGGLLGSPEEIWWQDPDWIDGALRSTLPGPASGWLGDRWTPLLVGVAVRYGSPIRATAAAIGLAAGRAVEVASPEMGGRLRARDVLVVEHPLSAYAPLLWRASALVSRQGSPAAHLCEVARSLRVPAVVAAAGADPMPGDVLVVDGDAGRVWIWPAGIDQEVS